MNLVIKGTAQVAVVSKTDAILLMTALNESGCTEPTMRKEVIGKDVAKMYDVSFDNTDISVCSRDDAETVARWMLALDCEEVIIRRCKV